MISEIAATAKNAIARLYLMVGEHLGLVHYRNCHGCKHCKPYLDLGPEHIGCDLYLEDEGCLALTDASEAVWCTEYEEMEDEEKHE